MNQFLSKMLLGYKEIFTSIAKDYSVLWVILPIFLFWIMLEFYFDTHKEETLGWNTAFGNGLSLFGVLLCV